MDDALHCELQASSCSSWNICIRYKKVWPFLCQKVLLWMLRLWFTTESPLDTYYFSFSLLYSNCYLIFFLLSWRFFFCWVKKSSSLWMQVRKSGTHSTVTDGHILALKCILMATGACICTEKQFTSVFLLCSQLEINIFKEYLFSSVFCYQFSNYILFMFSPLPPPKPQITAQLKVSHGTVCLMGCCWIPFYPLLLHTQQKCCMLQAVWNSYLCWCIKELKMKGGIGVEGGGLGRRGIYRAHLYIRCCAKYLFKAAFKKFMVLADILLGFQKGHSMKKNHCFL